MSGLGDRNSQSAQEYAAKKRDLLARAAELKREREKVHDGSRRPSMESVTREQNRPNVVVTSYGDYCEHIVIRGNDRPALASAHAMDMSSSSSIAPSSSTSVARVSSKRQQEVLARARASRLTSAPSNESEGLALSGSAMASSTRGSQGSSYDRNLPMGGGAAGDNQSSSSRVSGPNFKSSSHSSAASALPDITSLEISSDSTPIYSIPRTLNSPLANSRMFARPPSDPAGRLIDLSDRPIMCASSNQRNEVVFGCSDHALYAVDVSDPRKAHVQLYSKKFGHTDWVTSVAHLVNGQLISSSMDCRMLLWAVDRRSCVELVGGHSKSITKVVTDGRFNLALSCSYDCQAALWSFESDSTGGPVVSSTASRSKIGAARSRTAATPIAPTGFLTGHSQPIVDCTFMDNLAATGSRDGALMLWDLTSMQAVRSYPDAHKGQLLCLDSCRHLSSISDSSVMATAVFLSGGSDGSVKVWDARVRGEAVLTSRAHVAPATKSQAQAAAASVGAKKTSSAVTSGSASSGSGVRAASISCLCSFSSRASNGGAATYIASGGSDSVVNVLDIRNSLRAVHRFDQARVGVYSLCTVGDSCLYVADGAGMLLCYDMLVADSGDPFSQPNTSMGALQFGIQASSNGGVRTIACLDGKIATGAEDGKAIVFSY